MRFIFYFQYIIKKSIILKSNWLLMTDIYNVIENEIFVLFVIPHSDIYWTNFHVNFRLNGPCGLLAYLKKYFCESLKKKKDVFCTF